MTNQEVFDELKANLSKVKPLKAVSSLNELNKIIIDLELSSDVKDSIGFAKNDASLDTFFCDYEPKAILKKGKYLDVLNQALTFFKATNKNPYKKLVQAVLLSSRYLAAFDSFDDYLKKLKEATKTDSDEINFLENFRKNSGIFGMCFIKACSVFQLSGLLDIPVTSTKAKQYLAKSISLEDNNTQAFTALKEIAKDNNISCYTLNSLIDAVK